jgi:Transglutaminase-like superfamily
VTRRPGLSDLRAAWWAFRCLRNVRQSLAAGHTDVRVSLPMLPAGAVRGVDAVLRRARPTCLEAALVRQRWLRAQGVMRDVVVGVTAPSVGFRAHAWLEDPSESAIHPSDSTARQPWHELTRLTA